VVRTKRQALGDFGERLVLAITCPRCKRGKTLRRLPANFSSVDVICTFCGFLAQVKSVEKSNVDELPKYLLGGSWGPQREHIEAGIYFSIFIVVVTPNRKSSAVYYLPADLQSRTMFVPRTPLSSKAKSPGWQGFVIRLDDPDSHNPVRLRI